MINKHEEEYLNLLQDVLFNGEVRDDRTGTGTISVFGRQMRFDLSDGTVPLLTTKKIAYRLPIEEMIWFLSGNTNIKYLKDRNIHIWDAWADENDNLGPVYGAQWRMFDGVTDQISELINGLKNNPWSRRHIVSAWNPNVLPDELIKPKDNVKFGKAALPSCHNFFQCYVSKNYKLSMMLNIRSNDLFLGNPYNIFQYSVLLRVLCNICEYVPGDLIVNIGDGHIYLNHLEQVKEQLTRIPFKPPILMINRKIDNIEDFKFENVEILDYQYHDSIKAEISV